MTARRQRAFTLSIAVVFPLAAAAFLGQDANWDLRNYHLYNPDQWLRRRSALDVAPAQLQSWYNPVLDVPAWWLMRSGAGGLTVAAWLTLPIIAGLLLLLLFYRRLEPRRATTVAELALAAMVVTGGAVSTSLGATFNDGFVAAGVMASLFVALRGEEGSSAGWLPAGLIAGATAGLKLTAAPYVLVLLATALIGPALRASLQRCAACLAGSAVGFLVTYGHWALRLWREHRNPFFPYFNQLFQSPQALLASYADGQRRPASLLEAVRVPLTLLHFTGRFSEVGLQDPRLFAGVLGWAGLCVWWLRRRDASWTSVRLAAFFFIALGAWIWLSGFYRYAVPLELLACLGAVLFVQRLPFAAIALAAAVILGTRQPYWGRTKFTSPMLQQRMPPLPPGSMVVIASDEPLGHAVIALPDDVPAVAVRNNFLWPAQCLPLNLLAERRIGENPGPLWLLKGPDGDAPDALEARRIYGLELDGPCLPVESNLARVSLCPLRRLPHPPVCPASR